MLKGLTNNALIFCGYIAVSVSALLATQAAGGENFDSKRMITYRNEAGYVGKMSVSYFAVQNAGGVNVPVPQLLETPRVSVGYSRRLFVPPTAPGLPITVTINGIGTVKGEVLKRTYRGDFTGPLCFKTWGTFLNAQSGEC